MKHLFIEIKILSTTEHVCPKYSTPATLIFYNDNIEGLHTQENLFYCLVADAMLESIGINRIIK